MKKANSKKLKWLAPGLVKFGNDEAYGNNDTCTPGSGALVCNTGPTAEFSAPPSVWH